MDHATPSPMRNWGITLLYNFAFKSNYGSWIYKIRQIYESPVDHSFCYEYRRDSFCIWKRRWNSSKKFSEQVIWPILKNFHLIRGCVLLSPTSVTNIDITFRIWTDRLQCQNNRKMSHLYAGSKSWSQSTDETFSLKLLSYHHRLSQGFVTSFRKMLPNISLESDELRPNPNLKFILGSNIWENGSLDSQSSCEKWNIVIFLLTKRLIMWISWSRLWMYSKVKIICRSVTILTQ